MYHVKVGRYFFNLEELISVTHMEDRSEPGGPPPGGARVIMRPGMAYDLGPAETETLDRYMAPVLVPDPAETHGSGAVGARIDPKTGQAIPRRSFQGREPG